MSVRMPDVKIGDVVRYEFFQKSRENPHDVTTGSFSGRVLSVQKFKTKTGEYWKIEFEKTTLSAYQDITWYPDQPTHSGYGEVTKIEIVSTRSHS